MIFPVIRLEIDKYSILYLINPIFPVKLEISTSNR
jgi:hypothetical protein